MPLAMCTWCTRHRNVEFRTWSSARTGKQLVGDVCNHCYLGGPFDNCRTCRRKKEHGMSSVMAHTAARPIEPADVRRLLESRDELRHSKPD